MKDRNELLNEVRINLQNRYYLDQDQQELINDCVDALLEAINYTCCSILLKSKEKLSYSLWKLVKGYETYNTKFLKQGDVYVDIHQVIQEYEDYDQNFLIV